MNEVAEMLWSWMTSREPLGILICISAIALALRIYTALARDFVSVSKAEQWLAAIALFNLFIYSLAIHYQWLTHPQRTAFSRLMFIWLSAVSIYISIKGLRRSRE